MAYGRDCRDIVYHCVLAIEAFVHHALEATVAIEVVIAVEVVPAHLVYHDAYDEFRSVLGVCCQSRKE